MSKFVYTGTEERLFLFPAAFVVSPGDEIEAQDNPDELWFTAAPAAAGKAGDKAGDKEAPASPGANEKE